jgi:hypothetical protein
MTPAPVWPLALTHALAVQLSNIGEALCQLVVVDRCLMECLAII